MLFRVYARHLFDYLCTWSLSSGAIDGSIRSDNVVNELTNGLLVLVVGLKAMDNG